MTRIWLVEDEASIADTLVYKLESEHYHVCWFERGELALQALKTASGKYPHLMILDVGLPDITGFELAKFILAEYDIPIIFLTARNEEIDRIIGLEIGADDYIAKPFSPREVTARVKALLRRIGKQQQILPQAKAGHFTLDDVGSVICYYDQPLSLTRYEYLLLKTLIQSPSRVFSRSQLMDLIWQDSLETLERTVDTHIKTIRHKLTAIHSQAQPIQTHRGLGYSLKVLD